MYFKSNGITVDLQPLFNSIEYTNETVTKHNQEVTNDELVEDF